jgi:cysteine desulfurase family protein (TIGR01976 family)
MAKPGDETSPFDVESSRRQFPALTRAVSGKPAVFLDGPAGSQVPQSVITAMVNYLSATNANHGGVFATSRESDHILTEARRAAADFVGASDPNEIVFGANMTTLTFALSRALAKTWQPGDEIIVTQLDHDANIAPWVLAAQDAGATIREVAVKKKDCTLDLDDLKAKLSPRTKLAAITCASNLCGTVTPLREIARLVQKHGALLFLDAVHFAPHRAIDVVRWDCDFLVCSAYKFFGPHVGVLWGKRELLGMLPAYKVRPALDEIPDRWMTGTQNHEGIAGLRAAIDYLAEIGWRASIGSGARREAIVAAMEAITQHEQLLLKQLLLGLNEMESIKIHGLTDLKRLDERVPTVAFTHKWLKPRMVVEKLAEQGIFAWHGNNYALRLSEVLGLEPDGAIRLGLLHYNTAAEVDRTLDVLSGLQ